MLCHISNNPKKSMNNFTSKFRTKLMNKLISPLPDYENEFKIRKICHNFAPQNCIICIIKIIYIYMPCLPCNNGLMAYYLNCAAKLDGCTLTE